MFKKLKSILFEEVEIEEELSEIELQPKQPKIRKVEPIQPKESPQERNETVKPEAFQRPVQRIDLTAAQAILEESDETVEPVQPSFESKPKPTPIVERKAPLKRPQPYKPKPVISPMFGLTEEEKQRTAQIEAMKPKPPKLEDTQILSPIYGEVDYKAEKPVVKRRRRKSPTIRKSDDKNMTLEEMLDLEHQQDLEFTLFDVELDATEFQSREHVRFIDITEDN